ncbi:putative Serine/threonine-protein phosphatase [Blattamonas nauphoetae]|uniref:Serine/threonine-protein phosphatase n=1 Tax=Blattamonas nauphoetae TaxID=2049346 RepID=A0ABQ9X5H6_9EUKA|nr:putative Serine/threonine-protein phosphatase [Blattamonas nauphoetae]
MQPSHNTDSPCPFSRPVSVPTPEPEFNVKRILQTLLSSANDSTICHSVIPEHLIFQLISTTESILKQQPVVIDLAGNIKICGDVHAQFLDVVNLFKRFGSPDRENYLFLGDIVDRGPQSIETICVLFCYKILFPENFFFIRGNHECASMNATFGFLEECLQFYSRSLWEAFNNCFSYMPIAAVIDDQILCVHGGISGETTSLETIRAIERPYSELTSALVRDLLWNDPHPSMMTKEPSISQNHQLTVPDCADDTVQLTEPPQPPPLFSRNSQRGSSFYFSEQALDIFLTENNLQLLVRAHQTVARGFAVSTNLKCVTMFSAPNYAGVCTNRGGVMTINTGMHCSFKTFKSYLDENKEPRQRTGGSQPESNTQTPDKN